MDNPAYDRDNLPSEGWADWRKVATTRMTPVTGPCAITTKEGPYTLPEGWRGYLLRPGMGIDQLCVFRLSGPAERPYGSPGLGSRYQGQTGPTASVAIRKAGG